MRHSPPRTVWVVSAAIAIAGALSACGPSAVSESYASSNLQELLGGCLGEDLRACDELVAQRPEEAPLRTHVAGIVSLGGSCESGYSLACTALGRHLRSGVEGFEVDHDRAAAQFAKGCLGDDIEGCAELGLSFYNGWGVVEDDSYGVELMETSCENGSGVGCYYSATVESQEGGSEVRASSLLRSACRVGHSQACVELGLRYDQGLGVRADFWRATNYFARACDSAHADGCSALGRMYERGRGVPRDIVYAESLYGGACTDGAMGGCVMLATLRAPEDPETAEGILRESCSSGSGFACAELGKHHAPGGALAVDLVTANAYYSRSCELDHPEGCALYASALTTSDPAGAMAILDPVCGDGEAVACAALGQLYERGAGVERDVEHARNLYETSCASGSDAGCLNLGSLLGDTTDGRQALESACRMGNPEGCAELAEFRLETDPSEALSLLARSCDIGSGRGCSMEAEMLLWGLGDELDPIRALERHERACALGETRACGFAQSLATSDSSTRVWLTEAGRDGRWPITETSEAVDTLESILLLDAVTEVFEADGSGVRAGGLVTAEIVSGFGPFGVDHAPSIRVEGSDIAYLHAAHLSAEAALDARHRSALVGLVALPQSARNAGVGGSWRRVTLVPGDHGLTTYQEDWSVRALDHQSVTCDLHVVVTDHDVPWANSNVRRYRTAQLGLTYESMGELPLTADGSVSVDEAWSDGTKVLSENQVTLRRR